MGKLGYKMKNLFKSKEQLELEARMMFNKQQREFNKYYQELGTSVKKYTKMAEDAELQGNHANAIACAKFVGKLQKTQVKVQGLLQRFDMMHSMQRLSGVMTTFMQSCAEMGYNMDANINLKDMWKNTAAMDQALNKLDAMSEQMDMVFDTIDQGLGNQAGVSMQQEDADAEAAELLNSIMGRHNTINSVPVAPVAVTEAAPAAANAASAAEVPQAAAAEDDTDARLRRMMEDLKG